MRIFQIRLDLDSAFLETWSLDMASKNDLRQKPNSKAPPKAPPKAPLSPRAPWSFIQDQLKSASSIWESEEPVKAAECQSEIDRRKLLQELQRKLEALSFEPTVNPTRED